jgi:hypothetical protein
VFTGPGLEWLDFDDTHPYGDRSALFHGLSDHMPMVARCFVAPPPPHGEPDVG